MNKIGIGIDLGTKYSCCTYLKAGAGVGQYNYIEFESGSRFLGCYICYKQTEPKVSVGESVRNLIIRNLPYTVYNMKRLIGRKYSELILENLKHIPFEIINTNNTPIIPIRLGRDVLQLTAEDVVSEILLKIKNKADEDCFNKANLKTRAVISIPNTYKNRERVKTILAAEKANLQVLRLVNEPTASVIGFVYKKYKLGVKEKKRCLMIDFGSSSLSVSIIDSDTENTDVKVVASSGDNHLGGEDLDYNILNYFAEKLLKEKKFNLFESKKDLVLMKRACEEGKQQLMKSDSVNVNCDILKIKNIDSKLTREIFINLNQDIFNRYIKIIEKLFTDSEIPKETIDIIVLEGGSNRITEVQNLVSESFKSVYIYKKIFKEEVSQGASVLAIPEAIDYMNVTDIISYDVFVVNKNGEKFKVISKFSPVPCEKTVTITTDKDNQNFINFSTYECDDENNLKYGCEITEYKAGNVPATRKGMVKVELKFSFDVSGVFTISGVAKLPGTSQILNIKEI